MFYVGFVSLFLLLSMYPSAAVDITQRLSLPTYDGDFLFVGGYGPFNYSKIQDAVDNASDNDTVFVYAYSSPYYENVIVDKSINLVGENREITIVDGSFLSDTISIDADYVTVKGFTIINGIYAGIVIWRSNGCLLVDNILKSNYYGIFCVGENNQILKNIAFNNEIGIVVVYSGNSVIENLVYNNNLSGICVGSPADNNFISNNNVNSNNESGIDLYRTNNNNVTGNMIFFNKNNGIRLEDSYQNIIIRNYIGPNNEIGISILFNSYFNEIIENNIMNNNKDAFFYNAYLNQWKRNYWGREYVFPKIIFGYKINIIPWIVFDFYPAKEPYDI